METRKRKVFFLSNFEASKGCKLAEKFGKVCCLYDTEQDPPPSVFDTGHLAEDATSRLLDFWGYDNEFDLIVLTGSLIATSAIVAYLASELGTIRVLVFDNIQKCYIERTIGKAIEYAE